MKTAQTGIILSIIGLTIVMALIFTIVNATNREKGKGLGKAFEYDLSEFRKTDPALVKYKEVAKIDTGFQKAYAVAAMYNGSKDRIYIAGDSSIKIFGLNGDLISQIKLLDTPRCLAVDDDGTIYIGLKDHVEVYSSNGALKKRWDTLWQYALLTSIALDEDNVFVADAGNRVVWRYDKNGKVINQIGKEDESKRVYGLIVPTPYLDVAVSPDGLLRVANPGLQRIEAYTFDGYMELYWGQSSMSIAGIRY